MTSPVSIVVLEQIFGNVERGVHIEPPFYADYGVHMSIGEDTKRSSPMW